MAAQTFCYKRVDHANLLTSLGTADLARCLRLVAPVATIVVGLFLFGIGVNRLELTARCATVAPIASTLFGLSLNAAITMLALVRLAQASYALAGRTRVISENGFQIRERSLFGVTLRDAA